MARAYPSRSLKFACQQNWGARVSQFYLVMSGYHEIDRTSLCLAFDLEREFPKVR